MKKTQAQRAVLKVLRDWEGSMMEMRTAKEVIDALVKIGMLPPFSCQADLSCECGCKGRCPKGNNWDDEKLPIGANQVQRIYR